MARLAAGFGSSHSVMLTCELEDWLTRFRESDRRMPFYDREGNKRSYDEVLATAPAKAEELVTADVITAKFRATQAAMDRMRDEIAAAKLDVLVIVGDDQYELFQDQHMPSIGIYYGETIRNAARPSPPPEDWYKRAQQRRREPDGEVDYPCHAPLARHLIEGLIEREFDISAVAGLGTGQFEGHAYSFIHHRYLRGARLPIIPIFLNTYNPPNTPKPGRCVRLGQAIREAIAAFPDDIRVGVLASGGLSHFICEEDLDRAIIEALHKKDIGFLAGLDPRRLKAGSSEIRNWIVAASAAVDLKLGWLEYIPVYRTPALTGIGLGFARWS